MAQSAAGGPPRVPAPARLPAPETGWARAGQAALHRTILFPRWIGSVYIDPALQALRGYARGILLDVGCGQRPHEAVFRGQVTRHVGLDHPRHDGEARPDVVGDALHIPIVTGSVDTVLATEVMEHLPSPDDFLSEVARVLRAPGTLILSVPFMEPLHEEPRDFYRFTSHGLRALLERHGFTVREMRAKGGWWSVVVGSYVNQTLYEWANPVRPDGTRRNNPIGLSLALPLCALAQAVGYGLDRVIPSRRYTLGYVVVATIGEAAPGAKGRPTDG